MRHATLALVLLALAGAAPVAAEQVNIRPPESPKLTRAQRIAEVKENIAKTEHFLRVHTDARIAELEKKSPHQAKYAKTGKEKRQKELPLLRRELDWLEGRLTRAAAEALVKSLGDMLAKAKDHERPGIETALAAALAEVELIKKWESTVAP